MAGPPVPRPTGRMRWPDPDGVMWLAVGSASITAALLGSLATVEALATLLSASCGEDAGWAARMVAAAVASSAAAVGLVVGGWSLGTGAVPRHQWWWSSGVAAATALAWSIAVVSLWLPGGACP